MDKTIRLFVLLISLILLSGCNGPVPPETKVPKEGIWVCEELQAELNFNPPDGVYSTVTIDGEKLVCHVSNNPGSLDLSIYYQGKSHKKYNLGGEIFWLVFIDRDEDEMVAKDHDTGELYYFLRVD